MEAKSNIIELNYVLNEYINNKLKMNKVFNELIERNKEIFKNTNYVGKPLGKFIDDLVKTRECNKSYVIHLFKYPFNDFRCHQVHVHKDNFRGNFSALEKDGVVEVFTYA